MTKANVKVEVKTTKGIVFKGWTAEEFKSTSGYGRDVYVKMTRLADDYFTLIDCRYIIGYNFDKVVELYMSNYYGEKLKKIEIVKQ